jgi:hypothetical protein
MNAAVYPAGLIRRRRTRLQIEQLDRQILQALEEDHPQSVRHVYYQMTNPRLPEYVEKSERGYDQVQYRCLKLRRDGRLPYGWIADATRRGYFTNTYRSAAEFLRNVAGLYRADLWRDSETYVEVWCESRSIAAVIQDDCEELAVSLYPAGGFSSVTLCYEAAEQINALAIDKRSVVIFYIGDYDPAGVLIDLAIEKELRIHLDTNINLDFRRLAITPEQIRRFDLPRKPRKKSDRRVLRIKQTVEAEAMPARILRALLRTEIESLLPQRALEVSKVAEESEQEYLNLLAKRADRRL